MTYDSTGKDEHPATPSTTAHGIIFCLPSFRRYIPYAWLLYVDINREKTEIYFHFTHTTVIVIGTGLEALHDWASNSMLGAVEESPASVLTSKYPIVRRIELTEKPEE